MTPILSSYTGLKKKKKWTSYANTLQWKRQFHNHEHIQTFHYYSIITESSTKFTATTPWVTKPLSYSSRQLFLLVSLQQVNPELEGTARCQGPGEENLLGPLSWRLYVCTSITQGSYTGVLPLQPSNCTWLVHSFSEKTQWLFKKFCNLGTLSFVYFSWPIHALWPVLYSHPRELWVTENPAKL